MPKVPEEQPAKFNTTNVPGVQFPYRQEFGKVGQALQGLGGQVTQTADTASSIYNEVQRQQAISQSDNAYNKAKVDNDAYLRDLKTTSPDGLIHENGDQSQPAVQNPDQTPRTITQEYNDWSNSRYMSDQDNLSPMGAAMYRQKMLPEIGSRLANLNNEAHTMALNDANEKLDENKQANFKEFQIDPYPNFQPGDAQRRPDLNKFSDYTQSAVLSLQQRGGILDKSTGEFKGGLLDGTQIANMGTKLKNEYGDQWMQSSFSRIREEFQTSSPNLNQDVKNLLDVVNGQDAQSKAFQSVGKITPSDALSAEKRVQWREKLTDYLPTAAATDTWNFKKQFDDTIAATQRIGGGDPANFTAMLAKISDYGKANPAKNGPEAVEMAAQMFQAQSFGKRQGPDYLAASTAQRAAWSVKDQWNDMAAAKAWAKGLGVPLSADMGAKFAQEIHEKSAAAQMSIQSQLKSDPVEFASKVRPELATAGAPTGQSVLGSGKAFSQLDFSQPATLAQGNNPQIYSKFSNEFKLHRDKLWADSVPHGQMPISTAQSKAFAGAVTNEPSAENAAHDIQNLYRLTGKDAQGNIDQMVRSGALPYEYRLAGLHLHDPDNLTYTMSILNGAESEKAYFMANRGADKSVTQGDIATEVAKQTGDWAQAFTRGEPNSQQRTKDANALQGAIVTGAMKELRDPNVKTPEAVTTAYSKLVKSNTHVVDMGRQHFWQGAEPDPQTDVIPKTYNGKPVSDDQAVTIAQNLDQQRHHWDLSQVARPPDDRGFAPANDPTGSHFVDYINKNAKAAFTNSPEPGHYFVYKGTDSVQRKVLTKDDNGNLKPFFVPLSKSLTPNANLPAPQKHMPLPTFMGNPGSGRSPSSVDNETYSATDDDEGAPVLSRPDQNPKEELAKLEAQKRQASGQSSGQLGFTHDKNGFHAHPVSE